MIGYDEKDEEHFAIAVGALCDSGPRASASSDSKIHDAQRWRSIGNGGQWTIFRVVFRMYGGRPYKVDLHERGFDATNGAYGNCESEPMAPDETEYRLMSRSVVGLPSRAMGTARGRVPNWRNWDNVNCLGDCARGRAPNWRKSSSGLGTF